MLLYPFANPTVSNIRVSQRENTKLVDVLYDVTYEGGATVAVSCEVSTNAGAAFEVPASSFTGDGYGAIVSNGTDRLITWNAGIDWDENYSDQMMVRITAEPPRFIDNGDGTFTDNQTGLKWGDLTGASTYNETLEYLHYISLEGDGWRLPTHEEFEALANENTPSGLPYGHPFHEIASSAYWTSSTYGIFPDSQNGFISIVKGFSFYERESFFSTGNGLPYMVPFIPLPATPDFDAHFTYVKEPN